jgi:LuxR family maltose regulon positive regulatory protein
MLLEAERRCLRTGGDAGRALVLEALALAEPERIRRPFAHAGPAVHAVMRTDAQVAVRAGWLVPADAVDEASPSASADVVAEVDLTERELEVLQHLAEMLSTQEIGSAMFISVNTVRTHVRHILHKLSVTRRNEAVRRARVLQLI